MPETMTWSRQLMKVAKLVLRGLKGMKGAIPGRRMAGDPMPSSPGICQPANPASTARPVGDLRIPMESGYFVQVGTGGTSQLRVSQGTESAVKVVGGTRLPVLSRGTQRPQDSGDRPVCPDMNTACMINHLKMRSFRKVLQVGRISSRSAVSWKRPEKRVNDLPFYRYPTIPLPVSSKYHPKSSFQS